MVREHRHTDPIPHRDPTVLIRPVPRWTESAAAMHEFNCADLDHMTHDAMERDFILCGLAMSLSNCRAHWWYQHRRDCIRRQLEGRQR